MNEQRHGALRVEPLSAPKPSDIEAIIAPLDSFSRNQGFAWEPESRVLALRDEAQRIVVGLTGQLLFGWLRVEMLAVDQAFRGHASRPSIIEDKGPLRAG